MARSTSHALAAGLSILSILAHPASSYGQSFEYRYSRHSPSGLPLDFKIA